METANSEVPKVSDMVMCGDHPSFTKTELNVKETKSEVKNIEKEKPREKPALTNTKISPTWSAQRTGHEPEARAVAARGRVRSLGAVPPSDLGGVAPANRALLHAAMGSFRWPPYLVAMWVLVLLLTHALHCVAAMLDSVLPALKKVCLYFRNWTEDSWNNDTDLNHRLYPIGLGCITASLYVVYSFLYVVSIAALWAIEPLCPDDEKSTVQDIVAVKVTNYVDDVCSNTNTGIKH